MVISRILIIVVMGVSLLAGCNENEKTKILRLAHGLDTGHPVHKAMVYMSEAVEKKSGGEMALQIYPSQQLGTERQCVELLQIGSLDMTKVSSAVMEGFAPGYKVLSLPFIFEDRDHSWRVLDGEVGRKLLLSGTDYYLRGLCFYDAGSRSFYTKDRAITHPDDLNGLKIRVMKSPTAMDMVERLGARPAPISWGELYTSLQTGRVDAAENNPPSFYHSHHYEVCRYYCLDEHSSVPDVLLISTMAWEKLSIKERKWLEEAAGESSLVQRTLWAEDEERSLEEIRKAGVTIIPKEEIDTDAFRKLVVPMYNDAGKDSSVKEMMTKIEKLRQ